MYVNTPSLATARRFYLDALAQESFERLLRAEDRNDARGIAKWTRIHERRQERLARFHNRDAPRFPGA